MQGPKGPAEGSGRHFPNIHWSKTSEEATEQPNNQPTGNDHLKGGAESAQSHETPTNQSQDIHDDHRFTSVKRKTDRERGSSIELETPIQQQIEEIRKITARKGSGREMGGVGSGKVLELGFEIE